MRRTRISRICRYLGNGSRKLCVVVFLGRARGIGGPGRLMGAADILGLLGHTLEVILKGRSTGMRDETMGNLHAAIGAVVSNWQSSGAGNLTIQVNGPISPSSLFGGST